MMIFKLKPETKDPVVFRVSWFRRLCHKTQQWLCLVSSSLSLVVWVVQKKAMRAQHWQFLWSS